MTTGRRWRVTVAAWSAVTAIVCGVAARPAHADWKKPFVIAACIGGAAAGVKAGELMAAFEARRRNLTPQQAAEHKRAFQIGMGLALCGAAAGVTNSVYNRLSKRGREAREREIKAALEDAQPHAYSDPENPTLTGSVVAQPAHVEDDGECRVVEDRLAEETALVKYCRKGPGAEWKVKKV
jgi:hypothetical protein